MLPPNAASPRNVYLQGILDHVDAHVALNDWPKLTDQDQFIIGRLVVLYNFIEFNLRRMLEAWDEAGLLQVRIKGNARDLRIGQVETTVQAMFPWPEDQKHALERLAEMRNLRNLVAHFAARRFPNDDAFLFIAKSEADFRRQFPDVPSASNSFLTAILDGPILPGALQEVEAYQLWLATQTMLFVNQAHRLKTNSERTPNVT
jgi:hypothetical protein